MALHFLLFFYGFPNLTLERNVKFTKETCHGFKMPSRSFTSNSMHCNILEWISEEAPNEVVPQILSFVGSRKMLALSRVNSKWRRIILAEETWRTLCEDTGKWKEGDRLPHSWLQLYRSSPCVPIDYNSIESAWAAVTCEDGDQRKTARILLHPAKYILSESLVVRASGSTQITIETIERSPSVLSHPSTSIFENTNASPPNTRNSEANLFSDRKRKVFQFSQFSNRVEAMWGKVVKGCRSASATNNDSPAINDDFQSSVIPTFASRTQIGADCEAPRAQLIFKTRKPNQPLIHVQKGLVILNNLNLIHYSTGNDIWRGNAAIQLQPQYSFHFGRQPMAILRNVGITSQSGRGVVAIDGGKLIATKCCIHHCAGTGLFLSGTGSEATVEQCDIVYNGCGNLISHRGIRPGHSGIFVAQGSARVIDSNVSNNSLTGITPDQSRDNSVAVHIDNSDFIGNGVAQLVAPFDRRISHLDRIQVRNQNIRPGLGL